MLIPPVVVIGWEMYKPIKYKPNMRSKIELNEVERILSETDSLLEREHRERIQTFKYE